MVEKEVKVLLTKAEYKKIEKIFLWDKEYEQINMYYGDIRCLGSNEDITIRIRKKENEYFLQIKIPILKDGALHVKEEYEKKMHCVKKIISANELETLTGERFESDVMLLGELSTYRKTSHCFEGVEICLDRNVYLGKEDFELEIEFTGEYPNTCVKILEDNEIHIGKEVKGKKNRFMQLYMEINNEGNTLR